VPSAPPPRFPVIVGPTAGGKSSLAVSVAHALAANRSVTAEIITADAIQIYRGLDIGSAKPTLAERAGIAHHLIDIVDPTDRFSVNAWLDAAERAVREIFSRGNVPIVVGGTHLYIKAFLEGLFDGPEPSEELRAELTSMDAVVRRAELERVDPAAAMRIHPNDVRRTVRALEVYRLTGTPISDHQKQWDAGRTRRDCFLVGLEWDVPTINRRINARVKGMFDAGLLDEARALYDAGNLPKGGQSTEALGYKQLVAHFQGRCTLDEAVEAIKIETRRFAKNQRTWLRRLRLTPGAVWFEAANEAPERMTDEILRNMIA